MKWLNSDIGILVLAASIMLSLIYGCERFRNSTYNDFAGNEEDIRKIRTVAILPALNARASGEGFVACPVCGDVVSGGPQEPGVSMELTRKLRKCLVDERGLSLMPLSEVRGIISEKLPIYVNDPAQRLRRHAELLKVDAIIVATMLRYIKRDGGEWGTNAPASVAFDVHLLRSSDMATLWKAKYDETEKPISSDMGNAPMYLKRGVKWHSADELMEFGIEKICSKFPVLADNSDTDK